MDLVTLLEMASAGHGDRIAVGGARPVTTVELADLAWRVATSVRLAGAERLALLDVTSVAFPVALFGAACAGVPFVPLNYRLAASRLEALVDRLEPALVVHGANNHVVGRTGPSVATDVWLDGLSSLEPVDVLPADPNAVAVLLFTSGTTAEPKAAVLRHRHLASYVIQSVEFGGAGEEEASLLSLPPYHIAGVANVITSIYAGRRIVPLPDFTARGWLETAAAESITHAVVVPTMLARIVDEMEADPSLRVPTLRSLAYGGAAMPHGVIERALELFDDVDFVNAYGLTETSSTIAVLGPDDHRAAKKGDPVARARLSSCGKPLPGIEVEIRDEDGAPMPMGTHGNVWVRGEQVSGEYDGLASPLDAQGWFPARDIGWLDAEGYLYLGGRTDDVIIRGGENIAPIEIEEVLLRHPAVAECAVFGVADDQWGERIAAVVVLRDEMDVEVEELQAHVRGELRSSKTPDLVEFRTELPYTETGKLLRRVLHAELTGHPTADTL